MINKLIGFILILLFFLQFYLITSSKEFVCSKVDNSCKVRKLFYQNQVLNSYDFDNIDNAGWYWVQGEKFPQQQFFIVQNFVDGEKDVKVDILSTDFCNKKVDDFNEYLKNDVDEFSLKEIHALLILSTLLTAFFLIPLGVVLMRKE